MAVTTEMDAERQQQAREYAQKRRVISFSELVLLVALLLIWLFAGVSLNLRSWLESFSKNQELVLLGYVLIFGVIESVLSAPLNLYGGYYLPRKYGLSHQSFGSWLVDLTKAGIIGGVIGLILLELLYLGLRHLPDWWWLVGGVFYLLFVVVMVNLSPVLIMPLFNKFVPLQDEALSSRLLKLAERTGAPVSGVFTMDFSRRTSAANAFVTGIGNTRRIVLGDTLIENFTPQEIEVVMAHELGHQVHNDIWRGIFLDSGITLVGFFLAKLGMDAGVSAFGFRNVGDVAAFPLFVLVMLVFTLVTMPLTNGFSRSREHAADVFALDITHDAPSFIGAMRKLANQNLAELNPPSWAVWLLYSHPPIKSRVSYGEEFAQQHKIGLNSPANLTAKE